MKKIITRCFLYVSILLLLTASVASKPIDSTPKPNDETFNIKAKIDRRVELFTIVARLAGFEEYSTNSIKKYSDSIDKHFGKHKNHPAILFAKKLRKDHTLSYDAVMTMAVHLSQPPELEPRIPFKIAFTDGGLDGRWGSIEKAEEFVKLLRQFHKDSDFESFFKSQRNFYSIVEQRFQKVVDKVDFDWYQKFYGEMPDGNFYVYILLDSRGNYGPEVAFSKSKKDIYAMLTTTRADDEGLPVYGERHLATLIHEFSHPFVNPMFFANKDKFRVAGEKIYAKVRKRLRTVGYGNWESAVIESLVNAAVIRYMLDHETDPEVIYNQTILQINRGFIWMDELVPLLGAYENNRNSYPTFNSLLPLTVGYFEDLSKRIEREAKKFEQLIPQVVSISPFSNEAQDVDPNITRLTIRFNKILDSKIALRTRSISKGKGRESQYPITKVIGFDEIGTALTLEVKLKPDQEYEFRLNGRWFRTKASKHTMENYIVKFRTRKSTK